MFIIDTHAFLWLVEGDTKLSDKAQVTIRDPRNLIYISSASLFEIAIKVSIGRLDIGRTFAKLVEDHVDGNQIRILPVLAHHLDAYRVLPLYHRDPFDRIIIAQAISEGWEVISKDTELSKYDLQLIW